MISIRQTCAILGLLFLSASAELAAVTVNVSSSDSASWARSNGGTGTAMPIGGPGVWNSVFSVTIPPGATNIAFTLDSFAVDDKGVVQMNGATVGDAVIFGVNGSAAGLGTFDFGQGGGSQPYTFQGFTPGAPTALPNGSTNFTLTAYVNDTGTSNPSAPPTSTVTVASSFSLSGSLTYDTAQAPIDQTYLPVPLFSPWGLIILVGVIVLIAGIRTRWLG